jgi:uncharacterized membrane protein
MTLLITGVCLWAAIHLVPSLAPGLKAAWLGKLGEGPYKGSFALIVLSAMGLIIVGWRSAQPGLVYLPPEALGTVSMALMALAFVLLGASNRATRIGRVVRHPQLSGVLVWAVAHLLANGDSRSLVLFGGFAIWSALEMILISRREGAWNKPEAPGWGAEITGIVISLVVMVAVMWAHPWIAGVPLFY